MDNNAAKHTFERISKPPKGWKDGLFFTNAEGRKIHYGYAPAPAGQEAKGTIVLTHGYGEHINLYHEAVHRYQKMGFAVWGMDWQGFGKSDRDTPAQPQKPAARSMRDHVRDLNQFTRNIVKKQHPDGKPLILSTHSMGGHISLLHMKEHPNIFTAVIMGAPMFDLYRLGLGQWARPGVKTIFEAAAKAGLHNTSLPTMAEIKAALPEDGQKILSLFESKQDSLRKGWKNMMKTLTPDTSVDAPTVGWVLSAFETIDISMNDDFLQAIETPILIGSAEKDTIVANDSHEYAAKTLPNARHVIIENADHGMWFDEDVPVETWWSHIQAFIADVTAPPKPKESMPISLFEQLYGARSYRYAKQKREPA